MTFQPWIAMRGLSSPRTWTGCSDGNASEPLPDEPARLTARVLGRARLAVDGRVIPDDAWPPRGGRELLLLLLITPGHRLSRDRVLDALWPELGPDAARNAYYKALHSLRRVLEPDLAAREAGSFVAASAESVALLAEAIEVDIDSFADALGRARTVAADEQITLLREALSGRLGTGRERRARSIGWGRWPVAKGIWSGPRRATRRVSTSSETLATW